MKWLIELLGGRTQADMNELMRLHNVAMKDLGRLTGKEIDKIKIDSEKEYKEKIKRFGIEYKKMITKEKKRGDSFYQKNYQARKYLKENEPSNVWKKHHNRIVKLLD